MNKHESTNISDLERILNEETPTNVAALSRPHTWRDRLRMRLFPQTHCELPKAPSNFQDVYVCRTTIELNILTRIRVMLTGRMMVDAKTVTENQIGDTVHRSTCYALPWRWMDPIKITMTMLALLLLVTGCQTKISRAPSAVPKSLITASDDGPPSPCWPDCPTNFDWQPTPIYQSQYTNGELAARVVGTVGNLLTVSVTNVNPFREYELQFAPEIPATNWVTASGKRIGNTNQILFSVTNLYATGFFRAADVTGDDVIVYPTYGGGGGNPPTCPGSHVSYWVYLPTTNINFPFQPVGTNHSMIDPTGSTDTRIESVGRFGDYLCHASPLVFPASPDDPYYTMAVYFKTVAQGTNYPIVMKGFVIRPDVLP